MAVAFVTIGLLLALCGGTTTQTSVSRLVVAVDEVAEIAVDYKIGFACDDIKILEAWMVTREGRNWFIVKGVAPGTTWCRVGTDPNLPSYLFNITVVEPKPAPR